jgi:hypothetical protein
MSTASHLMTAEELIKLPGGSCRYELVKGEADVLTGGTVLPGFKLPLSEIFI